MKHKICKGCGRNFPIYPYRFKTAEYCSTGCRWDEYRAAQSLAKSGIDQPDSHRVLELRPGVTTSISVEDYDDLAAFSWKLSSSGYACVTGVHREAVGTGLLHRVVISRVLGRKLGPHEFVDHIDRDRLNNRRENLRVATSQQNAWNSRGKTRRWSQYKGVSYDQRRRKWSATIYIDGRTHTIGRYDDEFVAALNYDAAAVQIQGSYAHLNLLI